VDAGPGPSNGGALGFNATPGKNTQAQRRNARQNAYESGGEGIFGDTIHVVPNAGNNNTPSELSGGVQEPGKLAGLSAKEKAARKSSWEAKVAAKQERRATRQEAQRQSVAQKSARYAAPDPRGMGTDPLPKAGKTKPKTSTVAFKRGQR